MLLARRTPLIATLVAVLLASASLANGQTLPDGWTLADVGRTSAQGRDGAGPAPSGGSAAGEDTFTLNGAGRGITGSADQFRFVYQRVSGNQDIVARVAAFQSASAARAGLMVRQNLTAGAAHASVLVGPETGPLFTSRKSARRRASQAVGGAGTAPYWLKLSKRGPTITVLTSEDGDEWVPIGEETVPLKEPFYIGLAVTSGTPNERGGATFDNVARSAVANLPPTAELTAPAEDTSYTAPASMVIGTSATDADGTVSKVDFYEGTTLLGSDTTGPFTLTWTAATAGDYVLTAVATDDRGATTTSAPRTVTVTSDAPPQLSQNEPADADLPIPDPMSEDQDQEQERTQEGVNNVTRAAARIAADQPQSTALAAESAGATDTAPAVRQPPPTGLPGRAGMFTSPVQPSTTGLLAASDGVTAPASDQPSTAAGEGATDTPGTTNTPGTQPSTPAADTPADDTPALSVNDDPPAGTEVQNVPPMVALTSPVNLANFAAPTSVTLTATASDTDGTVTRVAFYVGATLVSTDTTSPYSFTWSNVAAGAYVLTAVAYDNQNGMTVSSSRDITVSSSVPASSAVFSPSPEHATIDHYLLKIFVAGADPAVAVPVATLDLGWPPVVNGECSADVSGLIDALAPGSYIATLTAVSNWDSSDHSSPSPIFTR